MLRLIVLLVRGYLVLRLIVTFVMHLIFLRKCPLSCVVFDVYHSSRRLVLYLAVTLVRAALSLTLVRAVLCSIWLLR